MSAFGQPDIISVLVLPPNGLVAIHRKSVTVKRLLIIYLFNLTGEVEPWTVNVEPPTASENGLSLNLRGRVYQATVRAVLLYDCEIWPIRAADLRRLQVFDNRCLRTIARVGWCRGMCNEAVSGRVL
ncbi:hypothetical protein T265_06708 [Opisthorchis viverrini]|uniref:Uncharacterized protein n=1 Tax=Opisthorchis viverrini TaxID=6198 RepID=A0A074ZJJ1_OPIVI|nr:hypothetical protein T265_06708 [Opisthorchis viverrini]KER25957.1 hypothetical protein T265_06708 [Opisthorchis viverrini]